MTAETKQTGTLMDQAPGESAVILRVGSARGPVKRRLVDMGLTPGTTVTVRKVAPFGDPIEVNLRGYELSLRKEDAAKEITVTTSPEEAQRCRLERRRHPGMVQPLPDDETPGGWPPPMPTAAGPTAAPRTTPPTTRGR